MRRRIEEALGDCLTRMDRGETLDACLRSYEGIADELRPLLEAAAAVRGQAGRVPEYSREAALSGRARMQAERVRQAQRRRPLIGWSPFGSLVVGGVVAAVVALAVLALSGVFDFDGQTSVAQAEGIVASAGTDSMVLTTQDGRIVVTIGDKTLVLDSNGNLISGDMIVPGRRARIEFEEEADGFTGLRIEVEDDDHDAGESHGTEVEFSGVIQSIDANTLTLNTSFGAATVRIDAGTEVKGTLQVGQAVKVHATFERPGSYLAREIEVTDAGDDHGDDDATGDDHKDNSETGGSDSGPEDDGPGSTGADSTPSTDHTETPEPRSGSGTESSHEDDPEEHESD